MISQDGSCTASEIYQHLTNSNCKPAKIFFSTITMSTSSSGCWHQSHGANTAANAGFYWDSVLFLILKFHGCPPCGLFPTTDQFLDQSSLSVFPAVSQAVFFPLVVFAASLLGCAHFSCYFQISLFCHTLTCSLNKTLIFNERRRWLVAEEEDENIYLDL